MLKLLYYRLRNLFAREGEKGEVSGGYWHHRIREAAGLLCETGTGVLLEIGCGEGLFLKQMASCCHAMLFGMDISREQLLKARQRTSGTCVTRLSLVQADAACLPFKASACETLVCINFFVNVADDDLFLHLLREMRRILKRGGTLIFDIRNARNPVVRLKYASARLYDGTLEQKALRTYHAHRVREQLRLNGFEIETVKSIGFPGGAFAPVLVMKARKS